MPSSSRSPHDAGLSAYRPEYWNSMLSGILDPHRGEVFHYTSAGGLLGIVDKGRIWASQAASLNDRSEAVEGWQRIGKILSSFDNSDTIKYFRRVASDGLKTARGESVKIFVVSASTVADDVNQWRLYASDGTGYCVVIDGEASLTIDEGREAVKATANDHTVMPNFGDPMRPLTEITPWIPVIYHDTDLEVVLAALEALVDAREHEAASISEKDVRDDQLVSLGESVQEALATLSCITKPHGFAGENEVRRVALQRGYPTTPSFRPSQTGIVAYHRLGLRGNEAGKVSAVPLLGVICGPRLGDSWTGDPEGSKKAHEETIRIMIRETGAYRKYWRDIPVSSSTIRLR